MRRSTFLTACLALTTLTAGPAAVRAPDPPPGKPSGEEDRPFLALWQQTGGRGSDGPSVRFAVWADGRVVYAGDPGRWGGEVRRGKLSAARVARLKAAVADTGVFDLKGTCYLVPDAPIDCLMVELGGKKQMLYWDEVEAAGYGINIAPKPQHLEFKRCWKAVNHLGQVALPDDGEAAKEPMRVPQSWYLKRPVQSE